MSSPTVTFELDTPVLLDGDRSGLVIGYASDGRIIVLLAPREADTCVIEDALAAFDEAVANYADDLVKVTTPERLSLVQ